MSFNLSGGTPQEVWTVEQASLVIGPWISVGVIRIEANGTALFRGSSVPAREAFYRVVKP